MNGNPRNLVLERIFSPWQQVAAANAFPATSALTDALERRIPNGPITAKFDTPLQIATAKYFATAAIEIWHRAVHSLLISIALTRQSTLWSIVCGYYATHYTFRGLANLLGYHQLFQRKLTAQLWLDNGALTCTFRRGREREHDWYRRMVAEDPLFAVDPFFSPPTPPGAYDVIYRDRANYADHLGLLPSIQDVNRDAVRDRLRHISRIEAQVASEITIDSFPDVDAIQVNAYQRIVRFRQFLDQSVGDNRLWTFHRNPGWAMEFTDFQIVEPRGAIQR